MPAVVVTATFANPQVLTAWVQVRKRLRRTNPKVPVGQPPTDIGSPIQMTRDGLIPTKFTKSVDLPDPGANYKLLLRIEGRNQAGQALDINDTVPR